MWDLQSYYRQFHTPAANWASHCRSWVDQDGPCTIVDHAMMFGDRPASNWAMRLSGLMADLTATVANACPSASPRVRRSFERLRQDWEANPGQGELVLVHSFVSCFIDDFSM